MKNTLLSSILILLLGSHPVWGQTGQGLGLLQDQKHPLAVVLKVGETASEEFTERSSNGFSEKTSPTRGNKEESTSPKDSLSKGGQNNGIEIETVEISSLPNPETSLLSQIDLGIRNLTSGQELLQLTPGLLIAQHAGGGKAEQMFFRGFDLDHGTDLALRVDGIPVNQVSHAHGQGYSDLHFLIPETVGKTELVTGPNTVKEGNFATAGALHLQTRDQLQENLVKTEYGSFGTSRSVAMLQLPLKRAKGLDGYFAGEFLGSRGYFEQPQDLRRLNLFTKLSGQISPRTRFKANLSWFQSQWDASGQIPERAVASGMISRFGAIDPTEGGQTARKMASLELKHTLSDNSTLTHQGYFVHNDFQLFSNFTFFLNNPVDGDRIRQTENRNLLGYQADWVKQSEWRGIGIVREVGGGFRTDLVKDLELAWMNNREDMREQLQLGQVTEYNAFAYWEEKFFLGEDWKVAVGLRHDIFRFDYQNDLMAARRDHSWKTRTSPKLRLDWSPRSNLGLFAKAGLGFHSNDSRTSAIRPDGALPRAKGVDAGIVWKPRPKFLVQATAWGLHLQQELVYVGDEGIVEVNGASRRIGLDLSMRYQISKGLVANANLNYAHARFENGDHVPLAPAFSTNAGLFGQFTPRWSGGMGYRFLMDRPANEDGSLTAEGFFLLQASARFAITEGITVGINGDNLLNREWNEAQFATTSQLQGEIQPVEEIHFTPGAPRSLKASLEVRF